jgi:tRNA(adenine34) deaminase
MLSIFTDEHFMRQAFLLAERAYEEEEVPIGAVVVSNFRIIGKGYNQVERLQDPTAHAEILAISAACQHLGSKLLQDCTLFVTIEPCPMCAAALKWAQLDRVVFGAHEPKSGFSRYDPPLLHPRTRVTHSVMEGECADLMKRFFAARR